MPLPSDSLEDEMVKLVAYTIVSVQRDHERVMPRGEGTLIVTDSLNEERFIAFMVSRYLASPEYSALPADQKLHEEDKKCLRVHYTVTHRWPREPARHPQRKVRVLAEIRDRMEAVRDSRW
jgi:hypothetical protein